MSDQWEKRPDIAVTDDWAKHICNIGKGKDTCRYLMMGSAGWSCGKLREETKLHLDYRVMTDTINAKGDNCGGRMYK